MTDPSPHDSPPTPLPIIHINAYPGTGKLTIARHLASLLSTPTAPARLVHNHLLIEPAAAILPRTSPSYQPLRAALRAAVFAPLIHAPDTRASAYIFTDFQSDDAEGAAVVAEYAAVARARGCRFVPVVLRCGEEENLRRLVARGREGMGKLVDVELVRRIRREESVCRFEGGERRLELDVGGLGPEEAARKVWEHVVGVCPELGVG